MATPVLTVSPEDRHAWFAGRTRAILKYLDAEVGPRPAGESAKVLDLGIGAGNIWPITARSTGWITTCARSR
jgi:hypothetical protein